MAGGNKDREATEPTVGEEELDQPQLSVSVGLVAEFKASLVRFGASVDSKGQPRFAVMLEADPKELPVALLFTLLKLGHLAVRLESRQLLMPEKPEGLTEEGAEGEGAEAPVEAPREAPV